MANVDKRMQISNSARVSIRKRKSLELQSDTNGESSTNKIWPGFEMPKQGADSEVANVNDDGGEIVNAIAPALLY